jgi:hypothetical protein
MKTSITKSLLTSLYQREEINPSLAKRGKGRFFNNDVLPINFSVSNLKLGNSCFVAFTGSGPVINEFISKTTPPHPCPLPPGERGLIISPPLRGGDEGEGDTCSFTNDRVSKSSLSFFLPECYNSHDY